MDILLPALVAVLLAQTGDRPALLAAILADRFAAGRVACAVAVAQAAGFALAAVGGAALAPTLVPDARALLIALAFGFAAVGVAPRPRIRDRLERWRIGGVPTAVAGTFILAFGEASQFVVAALAAWRDAPVLAGVGGTLGAAGCTTAAAFLGEHRWQRLPLGPVRWSAAALFAGAALVIAAGALHLV